MVGPTILTGESVRLEPLATAHIDGLVAASAEDPALYRWTAAPVGLGATRAYVAEALAGQAEGHMLPFAIVQLADDRVVGSTRFARIEFWDWPPTSAFHGRSSPDVCEIGYTWLARSATRSAVNTDAKRLLLTHAFETWRVHRVCFKTDVRNTRSQAAIERLGACRDGVIRAERAAVDGTVRDSVLYSITAAEWPEVKQRLDGLAARSAAR
jgi:RimJ/RimL family protein N-acetyltransferase